MVKKKNGVEVTLYNFNEQDEEEKKKVKKSTSKKTTNKKKNSKSTSQSNSNRFDFDNEFVIGLTRIDEEDNKKKKAKTKKKVVSKNTNKQNKKRTTTNKNIKNNESKKERTEKTKRKSKNKKNVKKDTKYKTNKQKIEQPEDIVKKKIKHRTLKYIFLAACVLIAIIATMLSPLFNVKQINVEGNSKLTNDELISLSKIELYQNTYKISKTITKKRILENPYIQSVNIKRKLPNTITIIVEEKKPTFMIEYGGAYAYINNQGYILEVSQEKLEVPVLQGAETNVEELIPGSRLCVNDLEKMSTVIKIMEVSANNDIAKLISRIDIENKQNFKIVFESEKKVAYIGNETDLSTKILNIKAIIEKEKDIAGEIFVNMDLKTNDAIFRQSV